MNKKNKFYIARIEPEKKPIREKSTFASPYQGTKAKDKHVYPYLHSDEQGKQYEKLGEPEELDIIYTSKEKLESDKKKKEEDKYSVNRIPSYYRKEENLGINRRNLADLKGEKLTEEEILERNRREYGNIYKETIQAVEKSIAKRREEKFNRSSRPLEDPLNAIDNPKYDFNDEEQGYGYQEESREEETIFQAETKVPEEAEIRSPRSRSKSRQAVKPENPAFGNPKTKFITPPPEILKRSNRMSGVDGEQVNYQINVINRTLDEFRVGGKVIDYTKGPTVTQFEIKLEPGVNVNKILTIQKNLQMNLESHSIRIEAPIPGKSTIGIEAPNIEKDLVLFGNLVADEAFRKDRKPLNVILGLSISGQPVYADIAEMPHALIAGATGGGKTVCLYSIICSILYKTSPEVVKMILIDPKRNELLYFEDIPHLATPIIDDPKLATAAVKWAVDEMERRYDFLKAKRKRTIGDYNAYAIANGMKTIPYIVIIIDEFSDLMNTANESFERNVQRLTQKARSAGIHIIIATQRPTTDVIKGTIKANIPTRIAFAVQSQIDSLTILDHVGADKLLGKGDMLYTSGVGDIRIQGAYISESELEAVSEFYYERSIASDYLFTHEELQAEAEQESNVIGGNPFDDEFFDDIARFVYRQRKASANQIQKTYEIGFNRANKILLGLAELGVISSENIPGKARDVLIDDIDELEEILNNRY